MQKSIVDSMTLREQRKFKISELRQKLALSEKVVQELEKRILENRIDVSVYCDTCDVEVRYGYVSSDSGFILNMTDIDVIEHSSHSLMIRDRESVDDCCKKSDSRSKLV